MNKIQYTLLFICLSIAFSGYAQDYGYKYGIMTIDGKIITPAIYDGVDGRALNLGEHHLVVEKNGRKGIIGTDGKQVGEIKYDYVSVFARPMYEVRLDGKCGFVNKQGKEAIPCIYDSYVTTDDISEWYCMRKGDKYGMVDNLNNVIIPFEYEDINYYESDGSTYNLSVQKEYGEKYALVDRKAEVVTPFIYDKIKLFNRGGALAYREGSYYFLSSTGKEIVPVYNEDDIKDTKYFIAVTSRNAENRSDKVELYSYDGKLIDTYKGYQMFHFTWDDKVASIKNRDGYIMVDTLGNKISELNVRSVSADGILDYGLNFHNNKAVATKLGRYGVIDVKGDIIIPFNYKRLDNLLGTEGESVYIIRDENFNEGLLIEGNPQPTSIEYKRLYCYSPFFIKGEDSEGREGIISLEGKELTPFIYDRVVSANNYLACLKLDEKIGFFNVKTGAKIDLVFDGWSYPHYSTCVIVEKDNRYGVINTDCKMVLDCVYEDIDITTEGYIIATNEEGQSAIFDMNGKMVRPFGKERLFYYHSNMVVFRVEY